LIIAGETSVLHREARQEMNGVTGIWRSLTKSGNAAGLLSSEPGFRKT
jgi:hypothetical protein